MKKGDKLVPRGTISEPALFDHNSPSGIWRTYVGFLPSETKMTDRGWIFEWMGAEGPYYKKVVGANIYRLQIVQQATDNKSVINLNRGIKGYHQNCHITFVNAPDEEFKSLYFGLVNNIQELDRACAAVGIKNS